MTTKVPHLLVPGFEGIESVIPLDLLRARRQLREHLTRKLGDPATRLIRTAHHR